MIPTNRLVQKLKVKKDPFEVGYWILLFMVTIFPLVFFPSVLGYIRLPRYYVLIVLSLLALYYLVRNKAVIKHPALIPLSFFLLFAFVSTILAPHPLTAWVGTAHRLSGFLTYVYCIIFFALAAYVGRGERVIGYMVLTAALVGIISVIQYLGFNPVPPFEVKMRASGTMGNPNFLGTYTVFILPAAIVFYLQRGKLLWLAAAALIYAGLLVSLTRGSWLAFPVLLLALSYYALKNPAWRRPFLLVVLTLFLVTLVLAPIKDWRVVRTVYNIPGEVTSAARLENEAGSSRMSIWKDTARLLPQHWAFGLGPDHLIYEEIRTREDGPVADKVHNVFLEIAVTMGVFALISYLAFVAYFLKPPGSEQALVYFLMVLTYLVQGFFNIDMFMIMPLFWIVLGLALSQRASPYSAG